MAKKTYKKKKGAAKTPTETGEPTIDPNAFKENTVRLGTNGYLWIVVNWTPGAIGPQPNKWQALGNHTKKKYALKKLKIEMNEFEQNKLDNNGIIKVSFNLTPRCEKAGKLPKGCDLELEGRPKLNPLKKTRSWHFTYYDYASVPTDKYKYMHSYEGALATMDIAVDMLKKHYGEHKRAGEISNFNIESQTYKKWMAEIYIL
jgi:hypothetical protein